MNKINLIRFEQQFEAIKRMANLMEIDILNVFPYGSRVYGTHAENSDYDYIIIANNVEGTQQFDSYDKTISCHVYSPEHWQHCLNEHKIFALECFFLPQELILINKKQYIFNLDKSILRKEISSKSSNSWVKCKKKLEIEKDYYIGVKSLFHSIRIPIFGTQIATKGRIFDYSEANNYWNEINNKYKNEGIIDWGHFKVSYQSKLNAIMTEFRKHAEKN